MDRIKLTAKDVPPMIRAAFPEYKGRRWRANVTTSVQMYDTQWSGGTRNQYVGVDLATGRSATPSAGAFGEWHTPREPTVELAPGYVVVEHSMFMGKDVGITIHVHPADVARLLPAAAGGGKRRAAPLGSGERFAALEAKIAKRGGVRDPAAVAAAVGRKKYGTKKFAAMAKRGRKRRQSLTQTLRVRRIRKLARETGR